MSKRKNTIIIICFILVILLGAGAATYPLIASINNERTQSLVQTEYEEKLQQLDTSEIDEALKKAHEYNKTISTVQIEDIDKIKENLPDYEDLLNLANNGIMGYIEIPTINIDLPIYHGTTGAAMEKGAGHMEGTSLPVGGVGTHAVISAHSGMAGAKLFTDLDKLKLGDVFFVTVCNEKLAYEVDNIAVVESTDIDLIRIDTQQDYVTLLTCTPYGVNTHRLLVRGHRVEMAEEAIAEVEEKVVPEGSTWIEKYAEGLVIGFIASFAAMLLLLIVLLIRRRQKRKPVTLPVLKGNDRMPNAYIELIDSLILQRQALKISQRELASAAGVSWTEVALMEQKKHMVQLRALLRIAAALNCKLVAVSVE